MFVVDTDILVYALDPGAPEHARARDALASYRSGDRLWFVTWGILHEFVRVSTHRRILPRPLTHDQAWAWVRSLLQTRNLQVLTESDRHGGVVAEVASRHPGLSGNAVHDFHIAALMLEHGVTEIRTADTDFHHFRFLRVVNPLD